MLKKIISKGRFLISAPVRLKLSFKDFGAKPNVTFVTSHFNFPEKPFPIFSASTLNLFQKPIFFTRRSYAEKNYQKADFQLKKTELQRFWRQTKVKLMVIRQYKTNCSTANLVICILFFTLGGPNSFKLRPVQLPVPIFTNFVTHTSFCRLIFTLYQISG